MRARLHLFFVLFAFSSHTHPHPTPPPHTPLCRTKEEIDESVAKKTDKLSNVDKKLTCLNLNQKFNPATGECCPPSFVWDVKTGKCKELPRLGATVGNPGANCRDIMKFYEVTRIGVPKDGLFFLAPGGIATFQTWCTFKGEYKGSALAMRKPGRINSMQKKTGALGGACTPTGGTKPNSIKYCKISDAGRNQYLSVFTENLLENTDGVS